MLATVNPSKWSLLVKSYYHTLNNQPILYYNEASHVLVNCTILTNKRTKHRAVKAGVVQINILMTARSQSTSRHDH